MSRPANYKKGCLAEDAVCARLQEKGYEIIGRRIKTKHGEIDILAKKDSDFFIFEVKARKTFEDGAYAIDARKIQRCINAFLSYAQKNNIDYEQIYLRAIIVIGNKMKSIDIDALESISFTTEVAT